LSSIAGVYSKRGENIYQQIIKMIRETLHRGPNFVGVDLNHDIYRAQEIDRLSVQVVEGSKGIGVASSTAGQPFRSKELELSLVCDGEIYNKEDLEQFTNREILSDKESILRLFEKFFLSKPNISYAMCETIRLLDGVYSFALFYKNSFLIARDPIGVKPLYLSEDEKRIAFASERKALWSIGMFDIHPLPPSSWAIIGESGVKVNYLEGLKEGYIGKVSLKTAQNRVIKLLQKAVEKRVRNGRVGVLFSGGLDSAVLAKTMQNLGYKPTLYCSGAENSKDVIGAVQAAKELDLPLKINYMTIQKVEENLPRLIYMIEETNPSQVSIALPLYFSTQQAKKEGLSFITSGGGADELFGGYARYIRVLKQEGYEALHRELFRDVKEISEANIQRDDAASMANSIELKLPYLDYDMVKYVASIPPQYKIARTNSDYIRKFILREIAKKIELPPSLANRSKIAMQYGSSSQKLLEKLAEMNGFNKNLSKEYGYHSALKLYIETIARTKGVPGINPDLQKLAHKVKLT
jgi:asparagine synthase (glutamine-hydrolysing)